MRTLFILLLTAIVLASGQVAAEQIEDAGVNSEIVVRAEPLQGQVSSGLKAAPEPGAPPALGALDDEKKLEYYRLRPLSGGKATGSYLSANRGGGDLVRIGSEKPDYEIFQLGYIDPENKIGRLRTANGWHLVALRQDGSVDAKSADPADPDTVLHFRYNGDGTYFVHAADEQTVKQVTGRVREARLRLLARPPAVDLSKRLKAVPGLGQVRPRIGQPRLGPTTPAKNAPRTLYHGSGELEARPYSREDRGEAVFKFEREPDAPYLEGRPGEPEGPSIELPLDLEAYLRMQGYTSGRTAAPAPSIADLLGIKSTIWSDQNEASGIYYFMPSAHFLEWKAVEGRYALSATYEGASGESESLVFMRAVLRPRVTQAQRWAAEMLTRRAAWATSRPFFELRQMPIRAEAVEDTVAVALQGYNARALRVRRPDEALGEVEITWQMAPNDLETFVETLRTDGLAPELVVGPGGEGPVHRLPLYLGWREPESYPPIRWENGGSWVNETPHPVSLRGLHAMVLDSNKAVKMLSWDLAATSPIPPQGTAVMGRELNEQVAGKAFFTWVDYAVVPDEASTEAVVRSITGGVSEQVRQPLSITLLDPLQATGAARIRVFIRSRYLQPGGEVGPLGIHDFSQDGETRAVPFYLGRAPDDVPFEWTASVIMPNGDAHDGARFLPGDRSLQLLVSSSGLQKIFDGRPWETSE